MISEDLPLPETPVTQIKFPKGKETSRFFKLFVLTFNSLNIFFFFDFLLFSGTGIFKFLLRYCAVKLFLFFIIFENSPSVTTCPP